MKLFPQRDDIVVLSRRSLFPPQINSILVTILNGIQGSSLSRAVDIAWGPFYSGVGGATH